MSLFTKQRVTDVEDKLMVTKGEKGRVGGREMQEGGDMGIYVYI